MNYVSFSLWGSDPLYNVGIIRNAELMKEIYTDWKMVVYYDSSVPINTIQKLEELDVLLNYMDTTKMYGMFWRFLAADIIDCNYCVFRDADSRLSKRERMAVDEWIKSGKTLHIMRDHPYHKIPAGNNQLGILGGMWGIKSKVINITKMIENSEFSHQFMYGKDQSFLKEVYQIFSNDKITHDEFFEKNKFPIKRTGSRFIGERIDINEEPLTEDYKIILLYENR